MGAAFPLIAGLVLSAAGTAAQTVANNKQRNAMNDVLNETYNKQNELAKQSYGAWQQGLSKAGPQQEEADATKGAQDYGTMLNRIAPTASAAPVTAGIENQTVADQARTATDSSNQAAAGLYGYSAERALQNQIRDFQTKQAILRAGNFAQGWGRVMPAQLNDAEQVGSGWRNAGTGLSSVAGLVSMAALPGMMASTESLPTGAAYDAMAISPEFNPTGPQIYAPRVYPKAGLWASGMPKLG